MINDEAKNSYYFAVKNLPQLNFLGWIRGKKVAIINYTNSLQNALNEALNYQTIETHPERISKIMPYIAKYNWKGIEFSAGSNDWKNLNKIIRKLLLIYYLYHTIQKE